MLGRIPVADSLLSAVRLTTTAGPLNFATKSFAMAEAESESAGFESRELYTGMTADPHMPR